MRLSRKAESGPGAGGEEALLTVGNNGAGLSALRRSALKFAAMGWFVDERRSGALELEPALAHVIASSSCRNEPVDRSALTRRQSMSRALLGALRPHRPQGRATVEAILEEFGDSSFGWAILFFALINMIPAPYGSTLITSLPLLLILAQMALGASHVQLPRFISQRKIPVASVRRIVIRMRRFLRPIERFVRPRYQGVFKRPRERFIAAGLFAVAVALFIPLPLSGGIPAFALLVSALALVERDGLLMIIGLTIGAASIVITGVVISLIASGVESIF